MHDVIIVGGGPTGFVTALGLAQAGVDVCLLEAEAGINDSPRACVYHWSMLDGLERLGIREEAERIGYTKDDYLWLVKKTGERLAYDLKVLSRITRFNYNIQLGQDRLATICRAGWRRCRTPRSIGGRPSPACRRTTTESPFARIRPTGRSSCAPAGWSAPTARAARFARRSAWRSTGSPGPSDSSRPTCIMILKAAATGSRRWWSTTSGAR
jgi:choline dehydrogenase-like flavoprotein